jgi:mevalonate kinase
MQKKIVVSAPGKIHLMGEHAVVYGKPALLSAIDRRCTITIQSRTDGNIVISSEGIASKEQISFRALTEKVKQAEKNWQTFSKTNDVTLLKSLTSEPLDYATLCIGITLMHYNITTLSSGFRCAIFSAVPVGSGIGSSASLSVSIAGALSAYFEKPWDINVINSIAYRCEQLKHGFPSGGDNSAVCYGKLTWFRKESPELKLIQPVPFSVPEKLSKRFILIDTGKPEESTGEMVSHVRTLKEQNPKLVRDFLENQEQLARELLAVVKNGDEKRFPEIIREGGRNLESIGVVSDLAKQLIRDIEKKGGSAKMCGAGGKKKGSGVVLAYHINPEVIRDVAHAHKFISFLLQLGCEGVKEEK